MRASRLRRLFLAAALIALATIILGVMAAHAQPKPAYPDRREFARKMAQVRPGDTMARVERLLGKPDDVAREGEREADGGEMWAYGTNGHLTLPTLGRVYFRGDKVNWLPVRTESPPPSWLVSEPELRAAMRYMDVPWEGTSDSDPLHLVRVANYLRVLGKDRGLAIIGEYSYAAALVDETWLFLLLRTLFDVPDPPSYMPDILIGLRPLAPSTSRRRVPRFPLVIVNDVPFSFVDHLPGSGYPQSVYEHLAYFRRYGHVASKPLRPPDDPFPAVQSLARTSEWAAAVASARTGPFASGGPWLREGLLQRAMRQVLALVRTALDTPEVKEPLRYPEPDAFERYHAEFLKLGARWDEKLQMYVRKDGSHLPLRPVVFHHEPDR